MAATHDLDFYPSAAGVSRSLQKLVVLGSNRLYLYGADLASPQTVDLPENAHQLSISADGMAAAIGHDARISYVNLATATLVRSVALQLGTRDPILAGDAVFFRSSEAFPTIHSLSLTDWTVNLVSTSGPLAGTLAPDGQAIIGLIPEQFRVSNRFRLARWAVNGTTLGTAESDLPFTVARDCPPVMISPNGDRIYSGCGYVFDGWNAGELRPAFRGTFYHYTFTTLDDSAEEGRIVAGSNSSRLSVYERNYLRLLGIIPLTPFRGAREDVEAYPLFIGHAFAPDTYWVVTRASAVGGLTNPYRIETIEIKDHTDCDVSADRNSLTIDRLANQGTITYTGTAGCVFEPTSDASWLSILTPQVAGARGKVSWSAQRNPGQQSRTGTISMGQARITITQSASSEEASLVRSPVPISRSAYSHALSRLIAISGEAALLHRIDPTTGETQSVRLPVNPSSLRLSYDGLTAIISAPGWLQYADLTSLALTRLVRTTSSGATIAVPGDGYTYVLPEGEPAATIRIRDSDGERTALTMTSSLIGPDLMTVYYSAITDPNSGKVYAWSGSGFQRIEFTAGTPVVTGVSSPSCGDHTPTEDWTRFLSQCGTVEMRREDLDSVVSPSFQYPDESSISRVAHSAALGTFAFASTQGGPNLAIYSDQSPRLVARYRLPALPPDNASLVSAVYWLRQPSRLLAVIVSDISVNPAASVFRTIQPDTTAAGCNLPLSPSAVNVTAASSTGSISVTAGPECLWEATSNADWLRVTSPAWGMGSGSFSYSLTANASTASRTGELRIGNQTVMITQSGGALVLDPDVLSVPREGGTAIPVTVTASAANLPWTATPSAAWITVAGPAGGTGSGQFQLTVAAAPSNAPRTGTVTVGATRLVVHQGLTYAAPTNLGFRGTEAGYSLSWAPVAGDPGGYQVMVATSPDALPVAAGTTNCAGCIFNEAVQGTVASLTPSLLTPGTTYYWQVNARNGVAAGAWSTVAQFTAPMGRPAAMAIFRRDNGELAASRYGEAALTFSGGALAGEPGVARNPLTGDVWVAARDAYNGLWLNSVSPTGTWGQWRALGGVVTGTPSVAITATGVIHIAVRDQYNSFWLLSDANGAAQWVNLGGIFGSDPAMALSAGGVLRIVGRDTWGGIWSLRRSGGGVIGGWTFGGGITAGEPSVAFGADGNAYIAARDNAAMTWVTVVRADDSWGEWFLTGGLTNSSPQMLEPSAEGKLAVAVVDPTGATWVRQFAEGPGTWGEWTSFGGIVTSMAASRESGEPRVAGFDALGNLWWSSGQGWSKWIAPIPGTGRVVAPR